jgi:alkanesulfonate monooxygenase SsuD/methylene tetrahydromethanopterin reductase-like flavin-dependent oxidoreductase (luciferase family)
MPLSSPTAMVNAAAAATERIAYLDYETRMFQAGMEEIGRPGPPPANRAATYGPDGMVFVGGPDEMAERILNLHKLLGHSRQIFQMDVGGMPHPAFLKAIELLGTEVLPQVRKELGPHPTPLTEATAT